MNNRNKKGFTLIEMLAVIAIIAVLVAIIVPVVTSSTTKARAAADAANLRSAKAEIAIHIMNNEAGYVLTEGDLAETAYSPAVKSTSGDGELKFVVNDGNITVYFGDASKTIDYYADLADDGKDNDSVTTGGGNGGNGGNNHTHTWEQQNAGSQWSPDWQHRCTDTSCAQNAWASCGYSAGGWGSDATECPTCGKK